jgi:hypothetical protein
MNLVEALEFGFGAEMVVQWHGFLLDRYVARKSSALAKCLAPEVPEPPDYFGSFFLNNILTEQDPEFTLSLTNVFLRRFANAVQDYQNGRKEMLACVAALTRSDNMVRAYMRALSYFEACIVNTNLALKAHDTVGKIWDPVQPRTFNKGDGSPWQRLNAPNPSFRTWNHCPQNYTVQDGLCKPYTGR